MSQTSHVGAIISTGTAYKAAVGETVAGRGERKVAARGIEGSRQRKENRNLETGGSSPARGPAPRSRDLNVKRARMAGDQAASELTSFR